MYHKWKLAQGYLQRYHVLDVKDRNLNKHILYISGEKSKFENLSEDPETL